MQELLVDCGIRTLLLFSGPDTVRYLNGQLTQDVRLVAQGEVSLPACVTDAKGRIQFRVWLSAWEDGICVDAHSGYEEDLEQRLTRYLIADDVEVRNLTGSMRLWHWIGGAQGLKSKRWSLDGCDIWLPPGDEFGPRPISQMTDVQLEDWRIRHMLPMEGKEPLVGSFPAELGLDRSDVSFHKGCYIGQEVISRIQTAGKVNRSLVCFAVADSLPLGDWELLTATGELAGVVTSVSPCVENGQRCFLAMIKRGKEAASVSCEGVRAGVLPPVNFNPG